VLTGRFLVLVPASNGCRLAGRGAFQLLDTLLYLGDPLFRFAVPAAQRVILGFPLRDPKIAWIGVPAQLRACVAKTTQSGRQPADK
jgi:hypothetical protein